MSKKKPAAKKRIAKSAVPLHAHPDAQLPPHPAVGEGRIWDGTKWLTVAPSTESTALVFQNNAIKMQKRALINMRVDIECAMAELPLEHKARDILQGAIDFTVKILDGKV